LTAGSGARGSVVERGISSAHYEFSGGRQVFTTLGDRFAAAFLDDDASGGAALTRGRRGRIIHLSETASNA